MLMGVRVKGLGVGVGARVPCHAVRTEPVLVGNLRERWFETAHVIFAVATVAEENGVIVMARLTLKAVAIVYGLARVA